jgi:hypothetical protein
MVDPMETASLSVTLKDILELGGTLVAIVVFYFTTQNSLKDKLSDAVAEVATKIAQSQTSLSQDLKTEIRRLEGRHDDARSELHAIDMRLTRIEAKLSK